MELKGALSRGEIVEQVSKLLDRGTVNIEVSDLQRASVDRFRKYESVHEVWTQPLPVAIVYPQSVAEISRLLRFCNRHRINVVARTGGTATEGGLETVVANSLVIDGSRMNRIIQIDTYDMQATVQCGVVLGDLEKELRSRGYTTGHSPQSLPLACLGGLTATRSIGQFSTYYGGIEDMVVGLEAVLPDGEVVNIRNVPRRAAGPDLRHMVIGNEGTLCYITEVTVKIFPHFPANNLFAASMVSDMKTGFKILREVMVRGYKPSVARLYDYQDATQHPHFQWLKEGENLLIFMSEGPKEIAQATHTAIQGIMSDFPQCGPVASGIVEKWFLQLNWDADSIARECREIRDTGTIRHTTEVSGNWSVIYRIYANCLERLRRDHPRRQDFLRLGGHSSHSYINGTNMYFIYSYKVNASPEEEASLYHDPLLDIICDETLKLGGSVVHHHGCGKGRARFSSLEHGSSFSLMKKLKKAIDPHNIMNAGCIFPLHGEQGGD